MSPDAEGHVSNPAGIAVTLSTAQRRLALLGLVDYEGAWDGLVYATAFVVDGAAKRTLIETEVHPLGAALAPLTEHIDPFELLAARYWFRHEPCLPSDSSVSEEPGG